MPHHKNSANRIVLVDHHENPADDRVSTHLEALGFDLDLRYPVNGDKLGRADDDIAGTVLFGGSHNVDEMDEYPFLLDEIRWILECIERKVPLLGICLGGQLIAHALGARVTPLANDECEFGYYLITPTAQGQSWIPQPLYVPQGHFYQFDLPVGATLLASGENCPNQAFSYGRLTCGMQFHPEVTADIFQRWQDSDWAYFDSPGAQTRKQQTVLATQHDASQHTWFTGFLERFFRQQMTDIAEIRT